MTDGISDDRDAGFILVSSDGEEAMAAEFTGPASAEFLNDLPHVLREVSRTESDQDSDNDNGG